MKIFITCAALILSASLLPADVPHLINYQGLLTDINGNVVSGSKSISIAVFDAPTAGTQLYSESIGSVPVQNGVYSFQFGSGPEFATALSTGTQHWLEVTIDTIAQTPRERLVSVPFALKAATAGLDTSSETRIRTLEDSFLLTRLNDYSYRSHPKPAITANSVWESFTSPNGYNSRVSSSTAGSFSDTQFNTLAFSVEDLPQSQVTIGSGLVLFKNVAVNAKVHRAEANFHYYIGTTGNTTVRIIFRYSDSTSSTHDFSLPPAVNTTFNATNPSPEKTVSAVEYYNLRHSNSSVQNARIATVSSANITVNLAPQTSNWTSFRVSHIGTREIGDSVTFTITNGTTTLSNLPLDTLQTWTGTSPPTSLVLTLTPSATGTVKGTSATTIGVFFNQ